MNCPTSNSHNMTRREFLWMTSLSAAGLMAGCAADPVTGKKGLMLVSEDQEIQIDKKNSPHQFSADYGITQDTRLNNYIQRVGKDMAALTHRPHMPYTFQVVNANYINAYAFPGGSIAATRGILLSLGNEAELAALMGHELGHVNARHTAEQMTKGTITQTIVAGIAVYAGTQSATLGQVASQLGMVGAGALLASYSRNNEREADALGMEYMVKAGYGSPGFVGLMDVLKSLSKHKPSTVELLFSTHPMSDERYQTAVSAVATQYQFAKKRKLHQQRYLDNTAALRRIAPAVIAMQRGERHLGQKKYPSAESQFRKALKVAPNDYAGLVLLSKSLVLQNKLSAAERYAKKAQRIYPQEAQAHHLSGYTQLKQKKFGAALNSFSSYDRALPGNPTTLFFKGYALEGMQRRKEAAQHYYKYLQAVNQGPQAKHAYKRLVQWGYIKPKKKS
ncbi:MAG: M48 family metalloprotease [Desulfobacterales bacterium]